MAIMHGAEGYFLKNGDKGVLLIHGYTGSPAELRLLGDFLYEHGFSVFGVRLAGHGTSPEDLNRTEWPDWYATVTEARAELAGYCSEVNVIGLSMGALLAMKAAAEPTVSKAVFLAAPVYVYDKRMAFVGVVKHFWPWIRKKKRNYAVDPQYNIAYDVMPLKALHSLKKLIEHCVRDVMPKIEVPCLVMQSRQDGTVRPESAELIYRKIGSAKKELVWIENTGHIMTLGENREEVFKKILYFLKEREHD